MKLQDYFNNVYKVDAEKAVEELFDDTFIRKNKWRRVFHEGVGDGIYSPKEGIVVVFDCDDLEEYSEFVFYKYNPNAWVSMRDAFNGKNGGEYKVELWHNN